MRSFTEFVQGYSELLRQAGELPLATAAPLPRPRIAPDAPKVLIFSPHPDDEVIIGGLALRLMRESGWRAVNVAVTQGSRKERQAERWEELRQCCDHLGFELIATAPGGLERVTPRTRAEDPAHWKTCVDRIAGILREHQPRAILFPHDQDWNSTHLGTHALLIDALATLPGFACDVFETEFWGQMQSPNLMVELSAADLSDLITALTFHVGEVRRNPYHLTLPAWMQDNARRGTELVGGQGTASPGFTFATLYRWRKWEAGALTEASGQKRFLPAHGNPGEYIGKP